MQKGEESETERNKLKTKSGEETEWRASNLQMQMRFYSRTTFVNQINCKNATVFFTNAFNHKLALNKE